ncbi:hypothetical protein F3Y22_tig00112293pilonHSYRG00089 [Hibiscus syriacus]|uniref:Uncharacterized protein n=1 Tax=Hibiscus syriacus TaxID=106335 RepID=A0A6A2Y9Q7_HIBSY|nr:hypothetical protein F3Y22_tig00112293pilonHSYRG00089 [Hibiscus syriacus]
MAEIEGANQLLEVLTSHVFFELAFEYFGKEFTSPDIFHDKEDLCLGGHYSLSSTMLGCRTRRITEISRWICSIIPFFFT